MNKVRIMAIQDLINIIPVKIKERGEMYFNNGQILELNQNSDGTWCAKVKGNYGNYDVEVNVDNNDGSAIYSCDCPYDAKMCKHIAAVAMAIDEGVSIVAAPKNEKKEENWKQLIKDAGLEDLRKFMLEYGVQDYDFRHRVEVKFSKPLSDDNADNIPYYQCLVSGMFDCYRYGAYRDYFNNYDQIDDAIRFVSMAKESYSNGEFNDAFCLSAAIIMEGIEAIKVVDDSMGGCSGSIHNVLAVIANILKNEEVSNKLKERIFIWLYQEVQNSDYNAYGIGTEVESLFFETAISLNKYDVAYKFIEDTITTVIEEKKDRFIRSYYVEKYLNNKIALLESEGRNDEVDDVIDSNLIYDNFRQKKVDKAISNDNLKEAEKLVLDGISFAADENDPSSKDRWKRQLIDVYNRQNETSKCNTLAREFFLENSSNIKVFRIYKQTSPKEEWVERRDELIDELKKPRSLYALQVLLDDFAGIYIEEQMFDKLLYLVRASKDIHAVLRYTNNLKTLYTAELLECYKDAIEIEAQHVGRRYYQELVVYLKEMSKIEGGFWAAKELKDALLMKYKNRRAMKEEFEILGWN